jgi:hypothetical protein
MRSLRRRVAVLAGPHPSVDLPTCTYLDPF